MSTAGKRNRNVLSIETKINIINQLEQGESITSLAKAYNIGKSTVSDIKNRKDKLLNFASRLDTTNGSKRRKTMKKPQNEKLDEAVNLWFVQKRSQGEPISGSLLCEKVLQMNKVLDGPENFKASNGWLKRFKSRHGIQEWEIQGESLSGSVSAAEDFKKTFLEYLNNEGYCLDLVYNADETGLNWKSLPHKSLISKRDSEAPDFKINKERVTIMVCANATGTHPLPLLLIGKPKKPRCFKNVKCLPVCYKAQKNAWMTSDIFIDWYITKFIPEVKKFKEKENKTGPVLLLLDNAPSHLELERLNAVDEDFKIAYLPPNITALVQPMNQGILEKFKRIYKEQILRRLVLAKNAESVVAFTKKLNLKDCSYMIADAWNCLTQTNLQDAWKKLLGDANVNEDTEESVNEIVEIFANIPGFENCDKGDALLWLYNDGCDPGFQVLEEDEILSSLLAEAQYSESSDDEEDGEPTKRGPTNDEAFTALEKVMAWCERQEECTPSQLLELKRMRDLMVKKISQNLMQKI